MECEICRRQHSARSPFLCVADARNTLYPHRLQLAHVLQERDEAEARVESLLKSVVQRDEVVCRSVTVEKTGQSYRETCQRVRDQIAATREATEAKRQDIARQKDEIARQRQRMEELRRKKNEMLEALAVERKKQLQMSRSITNSTSALCYAFQGYLEPARIPPRSPGYSGYVFAGLEVIDLRNLATLNHEVISASLDHMARTFLQISSYLSVCAPAPIIAPDQALLLNEEISSSRLTSKSIRFKPIHYIYRSTSIWRYDHTTLHVPVSTRNNYLDRRPLALEEPLAEISDRNKTNYHTFAYFVDALALLAYDIAWVCLSQNISIGDGQCFDDVINIGRNLANLVYGRLIDPSPSIKIQKQPSSAHTQASSGTQGTIGLYSHASPTKNLQSYEGARFIETFQLMSAYEIRTKLDSQIKQSLAVAEWEEVQHAEGLEAERESSRPTDTHPESKLSEWMMLEE